jgi:hypothetical protein
VVGGSAELVDVLLRDHEGEVGMHRWTSLRCGAGHCDLRGLQRACSPVNAPAGHPQARAGGLGGVRWAASGGDRYGRRDVCVSAS